MLVSHAEVASLRSLRGRGLDAIDGIDSILQDTQTCAFLRGGIDFLFSGVFEERGARAFGADHAGADGMCWGAGFAEHGALVGFYFPF